MKTLRVNLENCYGIKKFKKDFDFSEGKTCVIYASNGLMKTSFAKTFQDLSNDVDSKDLMFPDRKTVREIKNEDENKLISEQVFVVESYNENLDSSEKVSTLLVNKDLKEKYDAIHTKIDEKKDVLLKELGVLSGMRASTEKEVSMAFPNPDNELFISLAGVEKDVLNDLKSEYQDIIYKVIFNDKVISFLETEDIKGSLGEYIKKYDELIEASKYFKKGGFNHNSADDVTKSLVKNYFFDAHHTISLNSEEGTKEDKKEIVTDKEFVEVIEEEKKTILSDPDLAKIFEKLDTKLKANKELKDFREYLRNNMEILPELEDLNSFKQRVWISYFKVKKDLYRSFFDEYQQGKDELAKIITQANKEEARWREVIDKFNRRFLVPFKLIVRNQDDVILKEKVPIIVFLFEDSDEEILVEKLDLLNVLSSGEKKALYILNIIFEVEARKEKSDDILFVIDDIADSFDYKNKYAIIEYLKDISVQKNFYQIILTHNFDFFRTMESRFVRYDQCFFVEKTDEEIKLGRDYDIRNPFKELMKDLDDNKKFIASIPFVRNIIEYTRDPDDSDLLKLTSVLHKKSNSSSITTGDLQDIYTKVFPDITFNFGNDESVVKLIFDLADVCLVSTEGVNLENKILLAIAIRLKAEEFMSGKISGETEFSTKQTGRLFQAFKDEFEEQDSETDNIKLLERVILMTPENIHINAFMYEPILDMSDESLKELYKEIGDLK